MIKEVQKIPFLRLLFALITGIIAGSFIFFHLLACWSALFCLLLILLFLNKNYRYNLSSLFGITVCLLYTCLGVTVITIRNRKPVLHNKGIFSSVIMEIPVEKENSLKSVLKIEFVVQGDKLIKTDEKVVVFFGKGKETMKIKPGERVVFNKSPQVIEENGTPFGFNYKKYLSGKRIYRQLYLSEGEWVTYKYKSTFDPIVSAEKIRLSLMGIYGKSGLTENHQNLLSALTLGYKGDLDPETKKVFASSGTIHVLAVSGLHVGIVFMVFSFCFGFLKKSASGKYFLFFLSLCGLWFFALLTGLSPSVCRAALMLSLVIAGRNLKRRANIYNSLSASAFFLLMTNPANLFDAGFQLSYAAVFGIVSLQPFIENLFNFKIRFLKYLWTLLSVSFSAQLGTFPFSVYYFNRLPSYFWISNLFVIPAVTIIVPSGFILLAFYRYRLIFNILSIAIGYMLNAMTGFLTIIEQLPFSVIEISMSGAEIFFVSLLLLSLILLVKTGKIYFVKTLLLSFLMIIAISLALKVAGLFKKEIIVYNLREHTIIHLISGKKNYIISSEEALSVNYCYETVKQTVFKLKLDNPVFITTGRSFKDDNLCIIDDMVNFKDRIIYIVKDKMFIPRNIDPDLVICTTGRPGKFSVSEGFTLVVKDGPKYNFSDNIKVHNLREKGAFREKW